MKTKKNTAFFRIAFYGAALLGLSMVFVSLQSFERLASWLNIFSGDGQLESFTVARYQMLKLLLMVLGLILTILSGAAIVWWGRTQAMIERFFNWSREFGIFFRQDAQRFFRDLRDVWTRQSRMDLLMLGGLILAAVVAHLYQLNAQLLADEAYTYNAFSSGSLWVTVSDYHLPNNHVLLSILVNILTHLFGNHVWLIRLPTMIAGVLMVPVGYLFARRVYGRNVAILSAAGIAVFPILIMYSVWARGYGIIALTTLLILILGEYVRTNKNRFAWFLLILFSAAGFYTVPIMLFPFGALYLWLIASWMIGDTDSYPSKSNFFKYWLASGFASALLTVFLYAPILINDYDRFFHNQFVVPLAWDVLPASLTGGLRTMWLDWTSTIPGWIIGIGVIGLLASLLLHKKISRQKIPLQIVFVVWIAALIVIRRPDMNARLWLFMAAPILIWSAGGLVGILEWIANAVRKDLPVAQVFVGVIAAFVFIASLALIPQIPARWSQKSNIENTVLYLKDHLREGDIVNASTNSLSIIRYYFNVYDIPLDHVRRSGKFQRAFLAVSRESDSLETLSPVDGSNRPLIDLNTARIVLEYDGLTVYECYPAP